jgi:hypothetical protein
MDMGFEGFCDLIKRIKAQGYDEETAGEFAVIIGDTPCLDLDGNIVVRDPETNELLAKLKPSLFDEPPPST